MQSLRSVLQGRLRASGIARRPLPTQSQFTAACHGLMPARAAPMPHATASAAMTSTRPMSTMPPTLLRALAPSLAPTQHFGFLKPNSRDTFFAQRRLMSYARTTQAELLRRAEATANSRPHDSHAQAEYLALLNDAGMGDEVVRRASSGRFASGGRVHSEVSRAVASAGGAMGMAGYPGMAGAAAPPPPPQPTRGASVEDPLHVVVASKPSFLSMAGRLLSIGFTIFLCVLLYSSLKGGAGGGMRGPLESLTGGFSDEQKEVPEVKLDDVKGADEAKEELEHIVDYLKNPEKYTRLGGKIPKGVLLTGPPGTGKTLLARAIAGEAEVPFFYRSASEFEEMLVGLGASRVRKLFEAAQEQAPCIVFIDEIDAIGGKRVKLSSAGMDRQTLNQLLSSMDGFVKNEGVIVLAATNFPQSLDGALTRPGRFDVTVAVPLPDVRGRRDILAHYFSKTILDEGIDPMVFARATPGMSGADLEALVNQAALRAAMRGSEVVTQEDLDEAKDKLTLGPARKSRVVRKETLRKTAYHEGGHTLVAMLTKHAMPIYKTTILPRGHTAGVTYFLPEYKDEGNMTRSQIMAQLDVAMGGRVAEEIIFGEDEVTTGAGSDMQKASQLARQFVMQFSMSKLGLPTYDRDFAPSPDTQAQIDNEVNRLLKESYARASSLLTTHRKQLDRLANALLAHETLTLDEMKLAVRGEAVPTVEQKAAAKAEAKRKKEEAAKPSAGLFGGLFSGKHAASDRTPAPPSPPTEEGSAAGSGAGAGAGAGASKGGRQWV